MTAKTFYRHQKFKTPFNEPNTMRALFKNANCRNGRYLHSIVDRFSVPDALVKWCCEYPAYDPPYYDAPALAGKPWADKRFDDDSFAPKWNSRDGQIDRSTHASVAYTVDPAHGPINPIGRTGLCGRGLLGRWGPNHAADPIITRWKRDENDQLVQDPVSLKNVLQMVVIQRRDNGQWAIPGGMVDAGETIGETLRREFMEEALNATHSTQQLDDFFAGAGVRIYAGYVDDPRNTDNAWMETDAQHFHDADGTVLCDVRLEAGDDAGAVRWVDLHRNLTLYASHLQMVAEAVRRIDAHW